MNSLEPKLLTVLREGYSRQTFGRDLAAGLIVGVVALPLAIAFAIASGVKPEQGLYTAVVAGFLISVFGGSRVQIGGPTGAFIVLVYSVVQKFGYDGLAVATILAGALLIAMGLARFGTLIRFIPYPVTVGFTAGIAVVIASGQIRDALGLQMASVPSAFIAKWPAYADAIGSLNPWAAGLTLAAMLIILGLPRLLPKVPASLVALLALTVVVQAFNLPVETIGSRFGAVPSGLPLPRLPHVDWAMVPKLFSPALSIALLAGIESLLSAVVADGMTGRRHRSNAELVAQGLANIVSPLFGGIPATGAIARTATNVKSGGRTPVAGIIHALTLLFILIVAGKWAALVPMPVLAGILFVVAYNMSEVHLFSRVLRSTKSDGLVLISTFLLTVIIDLTVAIQVGVVLAAFLFMKRMADVAHVRLLGDEEEEPDINKADAAALRNAPESVEVFEVNGPFFFGAAHKFTAALGEMNRKPRVLILRMRHVLALDATGLRVLEELLAESRRDGRHLILSGVHAQPLVVLERAGFLERLNEENAVDNISEALARAEKLITEPSG